MNVAPRPINGLSVCSGAGGLDLAMHIAEPGYRAVCHIEREAYAAATLVARMEDQTLAPAPIWDDLTTFDGRPWRGNVDIVIAGIPCQGASVAGKRLGTEDERWLWSELWRVVRETGAGWLLLENVRGLLSVNDGRAFGEVLSDLAGARWSGQWGVFSAGETGASHRRERMFLLAHSSSVGVREPNNQACAEPWRHPWSHPGGRGWELGNSSSEGLQERQVSQSGNLKSQGIRSPERTGRDLVNADGVGQRQVPRRHTRTPIQPAEAIPQLADAESSRSGELSVRPRRQVKTIANVDGTIPLAPPGPGDLDRWSEVLAIAPHLEPAVCRMADWMAHRVDRLRLCGNGVHPLCGAYAYRTLKAALMGSAHE